MTPLTKQSLEQLKQKARAATPSPWEARCPPVIDNHAVPNRVWSEFGTVAVTSTLPREHSIPNAAHIAAASPDVVLDLISRVEGMQLALHRITWQMNQSKTFKEYAEEFQEEAKDALESFGVK